MLNDACRIIMASNGKVVATQLTYRVCQWISANGILWLHTRHHQKRKQVKEKWCCYTHIVTVIVELSTSAWKHSYHQVQSSSSPEPCFALFRFLFTLPLFTSPPGRFDRSSSFLNELKFFVFCLLPSFSVYVRSEYSWDATQANAMSNKSATVLINATCMIILHRYLHTKQMRSKHAVFAHII